jgi:hypothetical protein
MLSIPAKYPAHTRTWLMIIDAAVTDRAKAVNVPKAAAANSYLNHATGNAAYFARLYVALLEKAA